MRTRTEVCSPGTARKQRSTAEAQAYTAMCSLMLFGQMMSFGSLAVLPKAGTASWWVAALMVLPALAIYRLIAGWPPHGEGTVAIRAGLGKGGAAACGILFAGLLWLDVLMALSALTELTAAFVIEDAGVWQLVPWGAAIGIVGVWLGREMGAARVCYLLRWVLGAALILCVVAALTMGDAAHLFPWQFESLEQDWQAGLQWSGALWPILLMMFQPVGAPKTGARKGVLFGWLALLFLFFGYCFVLPAGALAGGTTWAERMVLFLRASPSKLVWEILLIFKMTVLMLNLTAGAVLAGRLVNQLTFPRVRSQIWASLVLAAAVPFAPQGQMLLKSLGPWRLPVAAAPIVATGIINRLRGRERA